MVGLGYLPGGGFASWANGVSADGTIVVGASDSATSGVGYVAFLWAGGEMHDLRELLLAGGATGLSGWTLYEATGVSADGRTIVGVGNNPLGEYEAWIATVPEPSTLVLALCAAVAMFYWVRPRAGKS